MYKFVALTLGIVSFSVSAADLVEFSADTPAIAAEVNSNFSELASRIEGNSVAITDGSYTAGEGIDINGTEITVISDDQKQNTIIGNCSVGQAIRLINADGSIECEDVGVKLLNGDGSVLGDAIGYDINKYAFITSKGYVLQVRYDTDSNDFSFGGDAASGGVYETTDCSGTVYTKMMVAKAIIEPFNNDFRYTASIPVTLNIASSGHDEGFCYTYPVPTSSLVFELFEHDSEVTGFDPGALEAPLMYSNQL